MSLADATPFLQVAAGGTYLTAAAAILVGRWRAPAFGHPWFVLLLFITFGWERTFPEYANVTDPLLFVFAALVAVQIARARGGAHRYLWRALAFVPVCVMILIAISARFPEAEASLLHAAESWLLASPAVLALLYAFLFHDFGERQGALRG